MDHFQGQRGEGGPADAGARGGESAARSSAFGNAMRSQMAAGSGGVGRALQGDTWTAADLDDGFGERGEEGQEDADPDDEGDAQAVSRTSSGFSGLGSTAWSKFSTLPHPSPRSGSASVGLASLASGGFGREDDAAASDRSDDAVASDSHTSAGAAWQREGDGVAGAVTELQVLHEIRSLPVEVRGEALEVIRRLRQGLPGAGLAGHDLHPAGHAGQARNVSSLASRSSTSPHHAARAAGGSSVAAAGRARVTKLTDSEPEDAEDAAFLHYVPPGVDDVEEGANEEDEDATASSWRSVEEDLSDDSTLARLAQHADAARAAAAAAPQSDTSPRESSSSGGGYGSPWRTSRTRRPGQDVGRGRLSATASPAAQRTPHRRTNYFVDNLELESPNKAPDDTRPCFEDDSEGHESLEGHCQDLVKDVRAQRAAAPGSSRKARARPAGPRGSDSSSAGSVVGSAASAPSPAQSARAYALTERARARLQEYDYAESVSSVTESVASSVMRRQSDSDAAPNSEEDASASILAGGSDCGSDASGRGAAHGGLAAGEGWDKDVAREVRRKIQALIRERERVGFLNVSFTSTDLGGLAKLVERVLRNKGAKVDEQLRSMLHNALLKYRHAVMQHEADELVSDVTEILQKERVFLEVVARMRRGYEQEMRDYQQYPPAVRDKLLEQLRVRRDRDMLQLDKERRARGHSHVQNVHSDSPTDSGSRASVQSDDFDATLDAAEVRLSPPIAEDAPLPPLPRPPAPPTALSLGLPWFPPALPPPLCVSMC